MNNSALQNKITCSFLYNYAQGLLSYASKDSIFAQWLYAQVIDLEPPSLHTIPSQVAGIPSLIPHDAESAQRRALWLIGEIHFRMHHDDGEHLRALLMEWAKERVREEPKAVLLGISIGILPVGIMGEMKRKHEPMAIILRDSLRKKLTMPAFLHRLTTLTHRVVELGLHSAKGKTSRLEPELGDWLFGHKAISLYIASEHVLRNIEMHVKNLNAPYASQKQNNGLIDAIAITPALFVGELADYNALEHIPLAEEGYVTK